MADDVGEKVLEGPVTSRDDTSVGSSGSGVSDGCADFENVVHVVPLSLVGCCCVWFPS